MNGEPRLVEAWEKLDEAGVDEALRKNPATLTSVDDAVKEGLDGLDALEDAIQTSQKAKPTWDEIKALFKRGNDFNRKARSRYIYNEIHLTDGSRLDSYIPGKEIISRKATTLSAIQASTFEGYLRELTTKYHKGKAIRSSKLPDGTTLSGEYILEIPSSNKAFYEASSVLKGLSAKYGVTIKYLDE